MRSRSLLTLLFFGATMMTRRRVLFVVLVIASITGLLWLMAQALAPGGLGFLDWLILAAFAIVLPWLVVGFWNSFIGLFLDVFAKDPLASVNPLAARTPPDAPISASTALLLCIRNELPARLARNLEMLLRGLGQSGQAGSFHVYVLSDTTDAQIGEQEALVFEQMAIDWQSVVKITYRRRDVNTGYKAGNIEDFCQRWGDQHVFAIVLDADSLMSAGAVLRLVRIAQANPSLGILQGLVVGLPSSSAFTRLFQFGMRLGMRSYTLGSAWWQGDCGPYWGHNAVIRLAPFISDCKLPVLKGRRGESVHILSHDQVEAVLMRRAGYDVRVYPLEDESYEENPPTLIDFIGRDLRWCAGNMQYFPMLFWPKLKLTSRGQLLLAILMFVGAPAWVFLMTAFAWLLGSAPVTSAVVDATMGLYVFAAIMLMSVLPKLASAVSVILRARSRRSFGGLPRFIFGLIFETIFSVLLTPILTVSQTVFLIGLAFGKRMTWRSQNRDTHAVSWLEACRAFGWHTLVGLLLTGLLLSSHPELYWLAIVFFGGLWLAVPLAVFTAWPTIGHWMQHWGLLAIPEEMSQPQFLKDLAATVSVDVPVAGARLDGGH
jgi:membrane glycosyltransferase